METQGKRGRYSAEVRARAVRLVPDHAADYGSQGEAIVPIAAKVRLHGGDAAPVGPAG